MANIIDNINTEILRQCRQQIGLNILEVKGKIKKIEEIEEDKQKPTFNQLNTLAQLYNVPRWVFISDKLPEKYKFDKALPSFRKFMDSDDKAFKSPKVRGLITKVERFRELIIELIEDAGEKTAPFNPPKLKNNITEKAAANKIKNWLNIKEKSLSFDKRKEKLEKKGVFIFMTSKYKGWSYIDKKIFRGLAIYHSVLPIIIINDSDAKKAQSFTLFHEFRHLLGKESVIDNSWQDSEKRCDEFAGNLLMPAKQFKSAVDSATHISDMSDIKKIATKFQVSPYACLVRLLQLNMISTHHYENLEQQLKSEYEKVKKKLKEAKGGPPRKREREAFNQYGGLYTKIIFQAYHNKEIGLNKLCQLFDFKKTSYAFKLEGYL